VRGTYNKQRTAVEAEAIAPSLSSQTSEEGERRNLRTRVLNIRPINKEETARWQKA
jgi:hypothetical protein